MGANEYPRTHINLMSKYLESVKNAKGLHGIAHLVGFRAKTLAYILYGVRDDHKYSEFTVPKKSGGTRTIRSPIPALKNIQQRLNERLSLCLSEIDRIENVKRECTISHGFRKNLCIATNADTHIGRRWVFNLDLKDFFPSINFGRVRGYFVKNRHFQLDEASATILAQICCWKNELPQGAPTSPVVSNLIASNLDVSLNRLARRVRCSYTRYADDLTFSTNKRAFPAEIAVPAANENGLWIAGGDLKYRIFRCGFEINARKSRMQHYWSRQDVTGLTVNAKVNIPNNYLRTVRARCEHIISNRGAYAKVGNAQISLTEAQVQGMLAHIFRIKGQEIAFRRPKDWASTPSYLRTHQKFLDYNHFANSHLPTVICEGKTDNVYIKFSLRAFDRSYPNLISGDGTKKLLFRMFTHTAVSRVAQGIGGGAGDLATLVRTYEDRIMRTRVDRPMHPVIVVVDNDDGPRGKGGLFAAVKQMSGPRATNIDGTEKFYYVCRNLYVVPTPLLADGSQSTIESFLDASVLKKKLRGKTLHTDERTFVRAKHISKEVFVRNIVVKNAAEIDFSGYRALLGAISDALDDYYRRAPCFSR